MSRMYRPTPRVVRIMVPAVQREPDIPEIEKEILDLSKRLGMGYMAGSNGPGMRMQEQSMRILCERLARSVSCALDLSAPRDKDADTSIPEEGFGDELHDLPPVKSFKRFAGTAPTAAVLSTTRMER